MKSVLISIKPKYCELIANGKKTVEVRKTIPKSDTPFKSYIYCTKPSKNYQTICGCMVLNSDELYRHPTQGIKYGDSIELMLCEDISKDNFLNGKVIGEFVCDGTFDLCDTGTEFTAITDFDISGCCLDYDELKAYANGKRLFGWHISALEIYDKPKELCEMNKPCDFNYDCWLCDRAVYEKSNYRFEWKNKKKIGQRFIGCDNIITHPPQSWCYVEDL